MSSIASLLKMPAFRKLFFADIFAHFGNWFDFTALMVLIAYEWKLGAGALSVFSIALGAPMILLGPLLGVWVDRLPLRNLMVICMFIRLLIGASLIIVPNMSVLIPLIFLRAALASMYFPARQSMVRSLVQKEQVRDAVSIGQIVLYTCQIVAPAAGGALIPILGVRNIFALEAGMLLVSALFLVQLPNIRREKKSDQSLPDGQSKVARYFGELREGLSHIRKSRLLFTAMILLSIGMFLVVLYDGLLVLWVKQMGFAESSYGTIVSMLGFGSVAGVLLAGFWKGWSKAPLRIMSLSALLAGLLSGVVGLGTWNYFSLPWGGWAFLFMFFGAFGAAASVPYSYILQTETPQHLLGRVSSVSTSCLNSATILGPAIGAIMAGWWGVGGVFIFSSCLMTLLAVLIFLFINPQPTSAEQG